MPRSPRMPRCQELRKFLGILGILASSASKTSESKQPRYKPPPRVPRGERSFLAQIPVAKRQKAVGMEGEFAKFDAPEIGFEGVGIERRIEEHRGNIGLQHFTQISQGFFAFDIVMRRTDDFEQRVGLEGGIL